MAIYKAWPRIWTRDYRETNPASDRVEALNPKPPDYNTSVLNHSATLRATGHLWYVLEENSIRETTCLSWPHRFRKAQFSWRIAMDGKPNRRNKAALSNVCVVWRLPLLGLNIRNSVSVHYTIESAHRSLLQVLQVETFESSGAQYNILSSRPLCRYLLNSASGHDQLRALLVCCSLLNSASKYIPKSVLRISCFV